MMTSLLPFLQLCRLPTLFTAVADVFLGYLLVHTSLRSARDQSPADFLLLLAATSGLYLSGMVFNDVFDRSVDAAERPSRPIPSGRVSLRSAVIFGALLMLVGLTSAMSVGRNTFVVAGLLAICILAYDGGLKRTPLGPVVMGACRFLNIIMAASSDWFLFEQLWWRPQISVAAAMGVYIIGVTWFARSEARSSSRTQLASATVVVNLGLAALLGWVAQGLSQQKLPAIFVLAVIALTVNRRLLIAVSDPTPARVQAAIKTSLLSVIMIDAALVFAKLGPDASGYAVAIAALLAPAYLLGRWIPLT